MRIGTGKTSFDYIGARNPRAAVDIGDAIEAAVSRLADYSYQGRSGRVPGTRELVVPDTPYVMVYRLEIDLLLILRLLHGAQGYP